MNYLWDGNDNQWKFSKMHSINPSYVKRKVSDSYSGI